jgi:hypothetical protein
MVTVSQLVPDNLLCWAYFVLQMISANARLTSGLERRLKYASLIRVRIVTPAVMYLFLSASIPSQFLSSPLLTSNSACMRF